MSNPINERTSIPSRGYDIKVTINDLSLIRMILY